MREPAMAAPPAEVRPHERMRRRILTLKIGLIVFFLLLVARLVQIQVLNAPEYQEAARRQYEAKVNLPAAKSVGRKGDILRGKEFA